MRRGVFASAAVAAAWGAAILFLAELLNPLPLDAALSVCRRMVQAAGVPTSGAVAAVVGGIAVWVLLQAGCLGAGVAAGRWAGRRRRRGPADGITALLLGWLAAALVLLGLGLLGLFHRPVLAVLAVAALAAAPRSVRVIAAGAWQAWTKPAGGAVRAVRWIAGGVLAAVAVGQLAPETHIDALIYHLGIAGRVVARGRLTAPPGNFLHHFPLVTELLRAWGLALGGEPAARLWTFGALVAGAAAIRGSIALLAGPGWGWAGFALWATSPLAAGMAMAGKPDVFTAAFAVAAVAALGRGGPPGAIVAGLLAGAAAGTKFQGAIVVPVLVVLGVTRSGRRRKVAVIVLILAGAAAASGPWLAKSLVLTGDPAYPFGKRGWGMTAAAVDQLAEVTGTMALRGRYDGWGRRLAAGWTATMTDGLPPLWLALVPLALLAGLVRGSGVRRNRDGRSAAGWWVAGALGWIAWNLGPPQPRYAIGPLGWLTVAAVAGLASTRLRRTAGWLAGACLVLQALRTGVACAGEGTWGAGLGLEPPAAFRARTTFGSMVGDLSALPASARVMYAGEWRAWPGPLDLVIPSLHEPLPAWPLIRASATEAGLARRWRQLGVTHVVHNYAAALFHRNSQTIYPWTVRDLEVWAGFWRRHAVLSHAPEKIDRKEGGYYVYALSREARVPQATPTLPGIEGLYAVVEAYLRREDWATAAAGVNTLDRIVGDFPQVMVFVARFRHAGDPGREAALLERAAAGGYRDPLLWSELARLADVLGRPAEAAAWRRRAGLQ